MTSLSIASGKVLSRSILFRHGARGPGESELSAWEKDHPVAAQWKEEEIENLSTVGESQMKSLGAWFSSRCADLGQKASDVKFSTSKSSRAAESGQLFVDAYISTRSSQGMSTNVIPATYTTDADYYFRPWKIYTEVEKQSKANMTTCVSWQDQIKDNQDLLVTVCRDLGMKNSLLSTHEKILWSLTYVVNVLLCEEFWPRSESANDKRRTLHDLILHLQNARLKILSLACWVWDKRFVTSGYQVDLGGWLFLDIIQKLFGYDNGQSVQLFAGHDYTIMSVLAASGFLTALTAPIEWGTYVIFELRVSEPTEELVLYVYHNRQPFGALAFVENESPVAHDDNITVHAERESLLATLSMDQLRALIDQICAVLQERNRGLPPGFIIPSQIAK